MERIQDRPMAILFSRMDKKEHVHYLENRYAMVQRYAREHEYYVVYGCSCFVPVKYVESRFIPFIINEWLPYVEKEEGIKKPKEITILVCFWQELVSNKKRPQFKKMLSELGLTVKEIGNIDRHKSPHQ